MKLLIIWNNAAQSNKAQKYQHNIEFFLKSHTIDYDLLQTKHIGHAKELVAKTRINQYQGVIAAGGDGTLFEVVNGLMAHTKNNRVPLGIIPIGTGNAFSRELKLMPNDWEKSLKIIIEKNTRIIDVGKTETKSNHFYFLNIIGMGFVVDVGRTTIKIKKLGKISYTLATLWQTIKLKKHSVKLIINNQVITDKLVFVEIANSRYTGSSFLIAPDAKIDDGLLDIVILKKISRPRILKLFPSIYSGKHIQYPEIQTYKAQQIEIDTDYPMPLMPDGEIIGETPVKISCIKGALEIFT